ncbi:MAG: Ca-activated chloride channel [Acidobacteriota bacterium]|nr:Ca-activated chloride channel [Acidobacteriota bacterium]
MRAGLLLLLSLWWFPLLAQGASDVEFDVTLGTSTAGAVIPVVIAIPVDQLRFVEDDAEQAARFSIRSISGGVTRAVKESHRIAAPLGMRPEGVVTYRFDVTVERDATAVTIVVVDENSGLTGTRSISIDGKSARVESVAEGEAGYATWAGLLARAEEEKKPIVVFYRSRPCARCRDFERVSIPHPTIERRLPSVVFGVLPAEKPGVALFDRSGVLRVRWPIVPDTTNFGIILDSVVAVAPHFERAVQLAEAGAPQDAQLAAAIGLARLGRTTDARAALEGVRANGSPAARQAAMVAGAALDAKEGKGAQALAELRQLVATAITPNIAADAWMAIGEIHRSVQATDEAIRAFTAVTELVAAGSPEHAAAQQALTRLRAASRPAERGVIRILPLQRQVVSGRHAVKTHVASTAVARVSFSLDGREAGSVERPPFSAMFEFGDVPERHSIRVTAFDRKGVEIGRDERIVNEAGESFWLRLVSPREGFAGGSVRVSMNVRVPAARHVRKVVVSWNEAERAVLTQAPWEQVINIPEGQTGVLRAVAELDDGRTSEDAVLLNAGGMVGQVDVQLVELPVTVMSRNGATPRLTPERIRVREGSRARRVDSVSSAAETPLTVGLLIDVSDSMQKTLPDLQEAAIRFLETMLGERDRAFLVTFDSRARLLQPATSDRALLRRQIMTVRPNGLTALHDAMVLGLLQFEGIKGRRAMVVFSDGIDMTSDYGATDVGELARRVNVPVHVIAALPGLHGLGIEKPAEDDLTRIAQSTGGTYQTLHALAELPGLYARIEAALRAQILVFVRTDPATRDNEWRSVQVQVEGEELDVFAPEGYYAAW